ncbi:MAG: hypothetical protein EP343_33485 [Deltaproteobacteria bacterium]|nr:MAG: hypothetical protein EP343_33485 [Deltaproteobacteria bacterium]
MNAPKESPFTQRVLVRSSLFGLMLLLLAAGGGVFSCVSATDETCQAAEECRREGLCKAEEGRCVAASDADCQKSRFCLNLGLCTLQEKRCVAGTEESCRQSLQCKERGFCLARNGECVEVTKAYCSSLDACAKQGLCSLNTKRYECVAGTVDDCKNSEECKNNQRCQLEKERCVVTDQFCKDSSGCQQSGLCSRQGDSCVVATDDDCKQSIACRAANKCLAENGACVETRKDGGTCKRACESNEDCSGCSGGATVCDNSVCATEKCADTARCKERGQCTRSNNQCIAKTSADCQAVCSAEGLCTIDPGTAQCVASTNDDCKKGEACTNNRRCTADKGVCIVLCKETACDRSSDCKDCQGGKTQCRDNRCIAPGSGGESAPDGGSQ